MSKDEQNIVVLIVDDDPITLDSIAYKMRVANYDVLTASDGKQAIEILKRRRDICCILTDIYMPEVDGYGVLRAASALASPPLVFFMTSDQDIYEWNIVEQGADGLFYKPFDGQRLKMKLDYLFKNSKKLNKAG